MPSYEPASPRPGRFGQLLLLLMVLTFGVRIAANLYIDMRWFDALGHGAIFSTILTTKVVVGTLIGLAVGLFVVANLYLAHALSQGLAPLYLHDPDGVPRVNLGEVTTRLVWPVGVVFGLLTGLFNYRHWETWLLYANGGEFGEQDPIFAQDVGFYLFDLPFLDVASGIAIWALGVSAVGSAATYVARGGLALGETSYRLHPQARAHLSALVAAVLVVLAFEAYLERFYILYSQTGPMTGASYADYHAKLPALGIKAGMAAVGAVLVLLSIRRESLTLAVAALVLYGAAYAGVQVYPGIVHRFSVEPNELDREQQFLQNNIEATRAAFALDGVRVRELSGSNSLTAADIDNNDATIDNVRLWDHQPLLDTFAQIQEIRLYYEFKSVDNDRYMIDGKLRQTMLSPRELEASLLPNATWINARFKFTHGYGLTLGPVNEATPQGLPVLMVQDIPPVSVTPSLEVTNPAIYFGELSNDHVFVRTRNREFHYPSGDDNVEADYEGKGGIRFDSRLMRLALSLRLGTIKLLLSDDIDSDSRVLLHRQIEERLARVAPFLTLDGDPYMVVREDGTLDWIYDAYTVSDRYPNAEPWVEQAGYRRTVINYIRNSVKAVINAYHGTVDLYVADPEDPIIQTWRRIFPDSFKPMDQMPEDLRAHVRYPELIFRMQAEMFTLYHMAQAQLLYNREDQWATPSIAVGDTAQAKEMQPYYTVMKLPGEQRAEFIQMLPFTPKGKQNLAAWMVARSDGEHLGELVAYTFPKDRLIFGPQQVVNRINQDAEISRQVSLWDQRGSKAEFGTLLVIPIEESLIYVRPLYLRAERGKIPELKRVIVVYENRIAMEPSLREAMDAIFSRTDTPGEAAQLAPSQSPTTTAAPAPTSDAPAQLPPLGLGAPDAVQALQHFERAVGAQRAGDWGTYGSELERVEALLRRMQPGTSPAAPGGTSPAGTAEGTAPTPAADTATPPALPPAPQQP